MAQKNEDQIDLITNEKDRIVRFFPGDGKSWPRVEVVLGSGGSERVVHQLALSPREWAYLVTLLQTLDVR